MHDLFPHFFDLSLFLASIHPTKYFRIPPRVYVPIGQSNKLMTIFHCFTNYPRLDATTLDSIAKKKVPNTTKTSNHLRINLEEWRVPKVERLLSHH